MSNIYKDRYFIKYHIYPIIIYEIGNLCRRIGNLDGRVVNSLPTATVFFEN